MTPLRIAFVQPIVDPVRAAWFRELAANPEVQLRVFALRRVLSHRPGWESRQDAGFDVELVRSLMLTGSRRLDRSTRRKMAMRLVPVDLLLRLWRYDPDAIVVTNATEMLQAAIMRWIRGAKVAVSFEDTRLSFSRIGRVTRRLKAMALRRADILFAHSSAAHGLLTELGVAEAKIVRTPWAVDNDKFVGWAERANVSEVRRRFGLGGIVFVTVAALTARKGIEQLLEAWAAIPATQRAKASLLLVGDGPDRERLAEFARGKALAEVRFAGHLPHEDVAACFAAANVFVLPTLEDVWGLVVNEAMATGLPVLCSRYAGSAEDLVDHAINGYIFDPLDKGAFAALLSEVIAQPERLEEMGRRSREIIAEFTINRSVHSLLDALRRVVAPAPGRPAPERPIR